MLEQVRSISRNDKLSIGIFHVLTGARHGFVQVPQSQVTVTLGVACAWNLVSSREVYPSRQPGEPGVRVADAERFLDPIECVGDRRPTTA